MPELAHFPAYVRTGCVRTYAAIDPKHAYRRDKRKRQGTTAMVIPCLCSFLLTVLSSASAGTCRGEAPPSCCARPFCRLKAPLGLSLLRCARKRGTCRGGAPPSCSRKPEQRSFCSAQNHTSFGVKLAYGVVFTGNSSKEKA